MLPSKTAYKTAQLDKQLAVYILHVGCNLPLRIKISFLPWTFIYLFAGASVEEYYRAALSLSQQNRTGPIRAQSPRRHTRPPAVVGLAAHVHGHLKPPRRTAGRGRRPGVWQLDDSTRQELMDILFHRPIGEFSLAGKMDAFYQHMQPEIPDVTPAAGCGEGVWIKWTDWDIKLEVNGFDWILELHGLIRHSETFRGWF